MLESSSIALRITDNINPGAWSILYPFLHNL